tara:strand:- start:518 stop:1123 length:606 start_codon:yes stop_codon:yes gene_type:complete
MEKIVLENLLKNNRAWASDIIEHDSNFFRNQTESQSPEYLWIGCSDSRVPASQVLGLKPGDLFVLRNIANQVNDSDAGSMSALQYAVDTLKVKHIIVCGHYNCGGVGAALTNQVTGALKEWLANLKAIVETKKDIDQDFKDDSEKINYFCELNTIEQVKNVCDTDILQSAWNRGQKISVHGWIYDISKGLIIDLKVTRSTK